MVHFGKWCFNLVVLQIHSSYSTYSVVNSRFELWRVLLLKVQRSTKRANKFQFIHWGIASNTWLACFRQLTHVVHMLMNIDICRSNLMSVIESICQVLSTQLAECCRYMPSKHASNTWWALKGCAPNMRSVREWPSHTCFPTSKWSWDNLDLNVLLWIYLLI